MTDYTKCVAVTLTISLVLLFGDLIIGPIVCSQKNNPDKSFWENECNVVIFIILAALSLFSILVLGVYTLVKYCKRSVQEEEISYSII